MVAVFFDEPAEKVASLVTSDAQLNRRAYCGLECMRQLLELRGGRVRAGIPLHNQRKPGPAEDYAFILENSVCLADGHRIDTELQRERTGRREFSPRFEAPGRDLEPDLIDDLPIHRNAAVRVDENQQGASVV